MKINELRSLNLQELNSRQEELKSELFNLRFQLATGQLENTARIKVVKRSIARVKTLITENNLDKVGGLNAKK